MISNELLKKKILDKAIHGTLVENDLSLKPFDVESIKEDIPFEIPINWKWSKLEKIFDVKGGKRIPKGETFVKQSKHIYIRVADMENMSIKITNLKCIDENVYQMIKNYIITDKDLYITVAGTIGQVGNVPSELSGMNLTENANRLIPKNVNKEFYKYILNSEYMQQKIIENTTKAAQPKLAIKRINELVVPVPPLEEQDKIVTKIEELFDLIDRKSQNDIEKEKLKEVLKEKILDSAIHGTLVENDLSLKPVEVESIEENIPFEIPINWKWCKLGSAIHLLSGQDLTSDRYNNSNDGIPYITGASNFTNGNIITNRWTPSPTSIAKYGDLLITCKGTIGEMAFLNLDKAHVARQIMAISTDVIDLNYIYYYLKLYVNELRRNAKSLIPGIDRKMILNLNIAIPPLEEQHRIVEKIEECFKLIEQL